MKYKFYLIIYFIFLLTFAVATVSAAPSAEGIQVYQRNVHLMPEHKQRLAEDIKLYRSADDLWDELRDNFRLTHYENDPAVQEQINWFMSHQDFLAHSINRAAPYLYYILQQAKRRNLPAEVVLLPIIESAYNPYAYSPAGASGIWQMMPGTATGYGIKQNWWYDGRRDVIASTKAALNYLAYLQTFFEGNWMLAIAAYDSGEGTVRNAIDKNIRAGYNTDFWSLPLPQETHIYVPRLLALAIIIADPDTYPLYLPPVRNAPYLAQMDVGTQMDLKHAASLAGLSLKSLLALNPGYNRSKTDPNGPFKIVLPIENVEQFAEKLATLPLQDKITWQHYKIKSGDTVLTVAKHFNMRPETLRKMNQLANNHLKPGKMLMVPRSVPAISKSILDADKQHYFTPAKEDASSLVSSKKKSLAGLKAIPVFGSGKNLREIPVQGHYIIQPGDTIYMARRGDTLVSIANHFHLAPRSLLAVNPVHANKALRPGEKWVIPTHLTKTVAVVKNSYQMSPGDTIYMVRPGDTLEKIAKRFHTTAPAIRVANLLNGQMREGDRLVIPTHM